MRVSSLNVFDGDLNRYVNIRRPADIWQWGNAVLWPGLLGNLGPECSQQQDEGGRFQSADMAATTDLNRPGSPFATTTFCPMARVTWGPVAEGLLRRWRRSSTA